MDTWMNVCDWHLTSDWLFHHLEKEVWGIEAVAAAFLSSAPSPSVLVTASCIRGFTHKRRKTLMRKPAAPVEVSVCLHHVLDFNWWRITVIIVWLSTCLRFPKDFMPDYLYPSFDMKRFMLALCSEKRLPIIGTGAVSSNPHLAPLY